MVHLDASMLRVSRTRWLVLCAHSCCCVVSFAQLCTLSPVQNISMERYGVSSLLINLSSLLFMGGTVLLLPLALYILTRRTGLQTSMLVGACCSAAGAWIRFFSAFSSSMSSYLLFSIGQAVCAVAHPFFLASPCVLVSMWFPLTQRAIATTVAYIMGFLGMGMSFLISWFLASQPDHMGRLLLAHGCLATAALVLAFVAFLPNGGRPKTGPPSMNAIFMKQVGEPIMPAIKSLCQNRNVWLLFFAFGLSGGLFEAFFILLNQIMEPDGFSLEVIGTSGFSLFVSAILFSLLLTIFVERTGIFKPILLSISIIEALFLTIFNIAALSGSRAYVFVALVGIGIGGAVLPVCMACAYEITYPISEEASSAMLLTFSHLFGSVFLVIMSVLETGPTGKMNMALWFALAIQVVCMVLFSLFQEGSRRRTLEERLEGDSRLRISTRNTMFDGYSPIREDDLDEEIIPLRASYSKWMSTQ